MAASSYIPSKNQIVRVGVALVILFGLMKFLPIPDNIRDLFRV